MKYLLSISVFFAFILLSLTPYCIGKELPELYDLTTNSQREITPCSGMGKLKLLGDGPRQHSVLWDTTHGVFPGYTPFVRFSDLVALLADSGYTTVCCGTGIHTIDLSLYDVIVIGVAQSWYSPYTQEEVDSLVNFYNQGHQRVILTGDMNFCDDDYFSNADNIAFSYNIFDWLVATGGILIMGDNANCNNVNINPIAQAFNMTAGITNISPDDLYFTNFAPHPIFANVSQVFFRAAGEILASLPAEIIAWTDSYSEPVVGVLDESSGIENEQDYESNHSWIRIVPNPFTYCASVTGKSKTVRISIYDLSGRLVEESKDNTIGRNLKKGIYFVKIDDYKTVKIVKLR